MLRCLLLLLLVFQALNAAAIKKERDRYPKKVQRIQRLLDKGRPVKVIRRCDHILRKPEAPPAFLLLRAKAHNDLAHWGQAASDARNVLRVTPGDVNARVIWATSLMGRYEVDSAALLLEPIVKRGPMMEADLLMARIHRHREHAAEALFLLDRVRHLVPEGRVRARVLRERAEAHALLGDTARARVLLDSALFIAPKDPVIHNSIGWYLYGMHGLHEQAIRAYTRAVKYNLNYSFAFNNRGWSYHKLGDDDKAFRDIRNAMNRSPRNAYTYRNLGLIHLDRGEKDKACVEFRKALERDFTRRFGPEVERLVEEHCKPVPIEGLLDPVVPEEEPLPPLQIDPVITTPTPER